MHFWKLAVLLFHMLSFLALFSLVRGYDFFFILDLKSHIYISLYHIFFLNKMDLSHRSGFLFLFFITLSSTCCDV